VALGAITLDGTNVAFLGFDNAVQAGIYASFGDSLLKVIDQAALLDGKTISSLSFFREGLSGNSLAFLASFPMAPKASIAPIWCRRTTSRSQAH
jgi:hypothetical protein